MEGFGRLLARHFGKPDSVPTVSTSGPVRSSTFLPQAAAPAPAAPLSSLKHGRLLACEYGGGRLSVSCYCSARWSCSWGRRLHALSCVLCVVTSNIEYLVISGDMTHKGSELGFERARESVSVLNAELGISAERCIFLPGNHGVQDMEEAFDWYSKART